MAQPTDRFELFEPGRTLMVAGPDETVEATILERKGTPERPVLKLEGIHGSSVRGAELLVPREAVGPLAEGEWLADDLVGCRVEGLGTVDRVRLGSSVDVLEVSGEGGEVLVPLNRDAIRSVDVEARTIMVNRHFLGLEDDEGDQTGAT